MITRKELPARHMLKQIKKLVNKGRDLHAIQMFLATYNLHLGISYIDEEHEDETHFRI